MDGKVSKKREVISNEKTIKTDNFNTFATCFSYYPKRPYFYFLHLHGLLLAVYFFFFGKNNALKQLQNGHP